MSDETAALVEEPSVWGLANRAEIAGYAYGIAAVVIWGGYFGLARAGTVSGLVPFDFIALRILPGACLSLPIVLVRHYRGTLRISFFKALLLGLCIGPLFAGLASGGFQFAPLAHAAVLQPGTMTFSSIIIAGVFFADKLSRTRLLGAAAIVSGLILVAGTGMAEGGSRSYIGDAMFASAGLLWAIYTALIRLWRIEAVSGTAAALVISGTIALPVCFLTGTFDHLAAFSWQELLIQGTAQGVLAGFLGVVLYGRSVILIGAGRATLFAAIVPVIAILFGIPLAGEWPLPAQWLGAGIVTSGLLLGLGVLDTVFNGKVKNSSK